jgi:Na+-driven multidrug efflux pump
VLSISRGILFVLLSLFVCTTLFKENGIWISCTVSEIFCLGIALYDLKTQKKI